MPSPEPRIRELAEKLNNTADLLAALRAEGFADAAAAAEGINNPADRLNHLVALGYC